MKIVIELDTDIVQGIKEGNMDSARIAVRSFQATIADAIKNGTPLPKEHGRLIDADALARRGDVTEDYLRIFAPTILEATDINGSREEVGILEYEESRGYVEEKDKQEVDR